MKKIISLILASIFALSVFSATAFANLEEDGIIANINDAMGYARSSDPIRIERAVLKSGDEQKDIYVVGLCGSNFSTDSDDVLCFWNCIISALALQNSYLELARDTMLENIPEGADIVFIGHSLGGMVAQQLAADETIKEKYNVLNTLTMGSPFVLVFDREGELYRMADSGDVVPYTSPVGAIFFYLGNFTYEDTGYFGDPNGAHNYSYREAEKWRQYDCLGIKNGGNQIIIGEVY